MRGALGILFTIIVLGFSVVHFLSGVQSGILFC